VDVDGESRRKAYSAFEETPEDCQGTALVGAAESGNTTILRMLLKRKAGISAYAPLTCLQRAMKEGHLETARILLDEVQKSMLKVLMVLRYLLQPQGTRTQSLRCSTYLSMERRSIYAA